MSEFRTATHVPAWRLCLYGFTALAVACSLGYHFNDRGLVIGAAIGIPLLMILMLTAFRFGRSPAALRHRSTILWIYILSHAAFAVWLLIDHHQRP